MADGSLIFDTHINEKGFSSGVSKIGKAAKTGLKVAGASLVAMSGYALKVGTDFDYAMSEVKAISGATGKDFQALRDKALEMGAKTKFSATEAGEAMKYMAMAGWKTGDMLNGVEGIMNLAAASGEDLATTSDIVTDALTAFGLAASDSAHFADVLAAASSNSNTNVGLMGATFKYVAPVAGALGYKVEDVALAIGLMANSGIKGEQAGTALRSILTRMSKPTDDVAAAMDQLHISLTNADGSMKPFGQVLTELRSSFSGLTADQKAQYAATLAGQEGMSGLLAIVNESDSDYKKLKDSIDNCDGSAKKMADTMNNNLKGQFTILKSSLEGLGIAFYDKLKGPLTEAVKASIKSLNELTASMQNGQLADSFTQVADAMGLVVSVGVKGLTKAIPIVIKSFSWFISHGKATASAIAGISTAMIAVKKGAAIAGAFNKARAVISLFSTTVTADMSLATKATELFRLATMGLSPTALTVGLIGLTAAVGSYLAISLAASASKDTDAKKTDELIEKHKAFTATIKEQDKAAKEQLNTLDTNSAQATTLAAKIETLANKEHKSAGEKQLLKQYIEDLNAVMPGLNLSYDENTDKLNQSTSTIYANIAALQEQAKAQAYQELAKKTAKSLATAEDNLAQSEKRVEKNTNAVEKAQKKYNAAKKEAKKHTKDLNDHTNEWVQKMDLAKAKLEDSKVTLKKSQNDTKSYKDEIADLNKKLNEYANSSAEAQQKTANFQSVLQQAQEAGIEIPESVIKGIQSGMYDLPQTLDQMKNLINFDPIAQKAKEAGINIPQSVSEGIMNGTYAVPASIEQLKNLISFDGIAQKAQKAGIDIPQSVSKGIIDGTYQVPTSIEQLKRLIQLDNLAPNAEVDGQKIPDDIVKGILSGKIKMPTSIEDLKALINSSLDNAQADIDANAEANGGSTPTHYQKGMHAKIPGVQAEGLNLKTAAKTSMTDDGSTSLLGMALGNNYGSGIGSTAGTVLMHALGLKSSALSGTADTGGMFANGSMSGGQYGSGIGSASGGVLSMAMTLMMMALTGTSGGAFFANGSASGGQYSSGLGASGALSTAAAMTLKRLAERAVTGGSFRSKGSRSGSAYGQGIGSARGTARSNASGLKSAAEGGVQGTGTFQTAGNMAAQGYANGINAGTPYVERAARAMVQRAAAAANKEQITGSPAKLFRDDIGIWASKGYAYGILDGIRDVKKSAAQMVQSAVSSATSTQNRLKDTINGLMLDGGLSQLKESARTVIDNFVGSATVPRLAGAYGTSGGTVTNYNQTNYFTSTGPLKPSEQATEMKNALRRMEWNKR